MSWLFLSPYGGQTNGWYILQCLWHNLAQKLLKPLCVCVCACVCACNHAILAKQRIKFVRQGHLAGIWLKHPPPAPPQWRAYTSVVYKWSAEQMVGRYILKRIRHNHARELRKLFFFFFFFFFFCGGEGKGLGKGVGGGRGQKLLKPLNMARNCETFFFFFFFFFFEEVRGEGGGGWTGWRG